jgi:hypothetical protein
MNDMTYKSTIESLMYAMIKTHPNLEFPMNIVNQYMTKLREMHWRMIKKIMHYFKGILDFILCFKGNDIHKKKHSNVDWANDAND